MNLFFDTSTFVKLYHEESGSEKLTDFLFAHSKDLIITISDLTKIEFHSTFLKYVRTGKLKPSIMKDIFKILDADLQMINIIEINNQIKKFAIELLDAIGVERSLRTLDALQLSAALISQQTVPMEYFVCSDKKLINIAKDYLSIFNPEA